MKHPHVNLTPAELLAIEQHKYYLSQRRGAEVSIGEAIDDFLEHFAEDWLRYKFRVDNLEQCSEIDRHKYYRSIEEGRDVGGDTAAAEWCEKFAAVWREERESLERQGFRRLRFVVRDPRGLDVRPWSSLAQLASDKDCDLYVHRTGMAYWNFLLDGRPYLNVKSLLNVLGPDIAQYDAIEFIVHGASADEMLAALEDFLGALDVDRASQETDLSQKSF